MKQERIDLLNKAFEYIEVLLNIYINKHKGNTEKTIVDFNNAQVMIQDMMHKKIKELNLSESEAEEMDKYYCDKLIELMNKYIGEGIRKN